MLSLETRLELGAGGGLVGLVECQSDIAQPVLTINRLAMAIGCKGFRAPLHVTDQEPMLGLMNRNVSLNNLDGLVQASIYDWGEVTPAILPHHPDIILAADCVYFEPAFPLLQRTLIDLIGESTICYFCFKKRRRADLHFIKSIKRIFDVSEVHDDPDKEIYSREAIFLSELSQYTTFKVADPDQIPNTKETCIITNLVWMLQYSFLKSSHAWHLEFQNQWPRRMKLIRNE
jgi:hypothetical protein